MNLNMDSFVNKLRNTVSHVAYQVNTSVNTIIPGNLIYREYETLRLRCTYGCPGFVWSVHDAVKRDSASIKASLKDAIGPNLIPSQTNDQMQITDGEKQNSEKQLYSVFLFDKSQIDSLSGKQEREVALEHIKKSVTQLTRLRHPAILTVHHPLEESRSSLAFVTEHVFGHLDSILKEQRSLRVESKKKKLTTDLVDLTQDLGPKDSDYKQGSCQLDEIQIKAGLLQVCDGLKFLHSAVRMIHRNLCLDNIFVDSNNTWKIAGFDFCCQQSSSQTESAPQDSNITLDIVEFTSQKRNEPQFSSLKKIHQSLPNSIAPNWSCSAPEQSNSDHVTFSSDVYSLGILSCALLGSDPDMVDLSYEYGLISDTYKRGIRLRELADRLPTNCKSMIMKFAAINADSRPSLDDYFNLAIFNDQQVQAIRDLDSQLAWDRLKKIDFFNRLREILPKLSHQVKVNRIARSLFNEFVNPEMLSFVLPSIIIIAKDSTPSEFKAKIFPHLKGPFRILEPRSVPLMLLDNLLVLADRAKNCLPEFQQCAFTLIQYLLRMDKQMQEKCFVVLPTVKRYIDELSLNNMIMPELARLHKETLDTTVRVKTLECISNLSDIMNQRTVVNHVLPILLEMPCRDAVVVMAAIGVVKSIINSTQIDLSKEILATKILPFLIPLCIERELDLQQFSSVMTLIKSTMDRVEREQREILGRKARVSSHKSSAPLSLSNFKGSNHFQLD